jgi:Leucine-rich repeat (LRR) protein
LSYAFLNDNEFSGTIPTEFGVLPNLIYLHLHNNDLEGEIPMELGELGGSLRELVLAANLLSSTVPSQLGLLTDLTMLYLTHNRDLTGTIPSELSRLENLQVFGMNDTSISGVIPENLLGATIKMTFEYHHQQCELSLPCN